MRRGILLTILAISLSSCATPPPGGSTGGRVDPFRTTKGDRWSNAASMPALLEFSDQVTDMLAVELCDVAEVKATPTKKVLYLGDIRNVSRTANNDFVIIQRRVRDRLVGLSSLLKKSRG